MDDKQIDIEPLGRRVPDAAKMLGVSESMIWKELKAGRLEKFKIGTATLVTTHSIKARASAATEGKNGVAG